MTNPICKKYDIKDIPDENNLVVLVDKHDGFFNACFVDKIDWENDWYDHVEKWCYLDKLIAQATKAERLQKAVDLALGWLEKVATPEKCDDDLCREFTKRKIDEIKQLIKENQ